MWISVSIGFSLVKILEKMRFHVRKSCLNNTDRIRMFAKHVIEYLTFLSSIMDCNDSVIVICSISYNFYNCISFFFNNYTLHLDIVSNK